MKNLAAILLVGMGMMLSGCTVAHYYFVRNLSEENVVVYIQFDGARVNGIVLPDSIFIPFASFSHPINKNTYSLMKDSVLVKKWNPSKMRLSLPSGSMVMLDKTTLRKINYAEPYSIEVVAPGKNSYTVDVNVSSEEGKYFKEKGKAPHLHWYDIY